MLKHRTVLVLGAGASMPYGFPSGEGLRRMIVDQSQPGSGSAERAMDQLEPDPTPMTDEVRASRARFSIETRVSEFHEAFRTSGVKSIDAFLANRRDLADVGKYFIAAALAPFEREASLHEPEKPQHDWYRELWEVLSGHVAYPAGSNLSVVTLNYDRSFEAFLTRSAASLFDWDYQRASLKIATSVPIHHVHGVLGEWPNQEYGYLMKSEREPLTAAGLIGSRRIRVLHEGGEFAAAAEALRRAQRIIFLGFAFNEDVIEALFPDRLWDTPTRDDPPPQLFATAYKVGDAKRERVQTLIPSRMVRAFPAGVAGVRLGAPETDAKRMLEDVVIVE